MADQESTDRLNDGERQILRLLVEGHTAKSIAATLDLSVNAVNERLREARRKTGAASSRELARTLRLQENGDKQIGVSAAVVGGAASWMPGTAMTARRFPLWSLLAMFILAAAGIAALMLAQPVATSPQDGPPTFSGEFSPDMFKKMGAAREQRFQNEAVDPTWAPEAEENLREAYAAVDGLVITDVHCATTLCKLTATEQPGKTVDMLNVGVPALRQKLSAAGLLSKSFSVEVKKGFAGDQMEPRRITVWAERKAQS